MLRTIWIASHFHNKIRINLFRETLKSIEYQTEKPDLVIISFSIQENLIHYKEIIEEMFNNLTVKYVLLYQENRHYQFEHLYKIYTYVKENYSKKVYITFLDDDDLLHENYIEITNNYLTYDKIRTRFYPIREDTLYNDKDTFRNVPSKYTEFGGTSCTLEFYEDFLESNFNNCNEQMIDLYFAVYIYNKFTEIQLNEILYYYRKYLYLPLSRIHFFDKEITNSVEYQKLIKVSNDTELDNWLFNLKKSQKDDPINKNV